MKSHTGAHCAIIRAFKLLVWKSTWWGCTQERSRSNVTSATSLPPNLDIYSGTWGRTLGRDHSSATNAAKPTNRSKILQNMSKFIFDLIKSTCNQCNRACIDKRDPGKHVKFIFKLNMIYLNSNQCKQGTAEYSWISVILNHVDVLFNLKYMTIKMCRRSTFVGYKIPEHVFSSSYHCLREGYKNPRPFMNKSLTFHPSDPILAMSDQRQWVAAAEAVFQQRSPFLNTFQRCHTKYIDSIVAI